ncbi:Uncharacterised protein [Vibrio cholerae]|nr:Uncharacterised protein [Vibrio cholerae]
MKGKPAQVKRCSLRRAITVRIVLLHPFWF